MNAKAVDIPKSVNTCKSCPYCRYVILHFSSFTIPESGDFEIPSEEIASMAVNQSLKDLIDQFALQRRQVSKNSAMAVVKELAAFILTINLR